MPLPAGPTVGDVLSFLATEDGRSVVYLADQETDEEFRIYHVFADGRTPPTRVGNFSFLNAEYEFVLSPYAERVVEYRSTQSAFLYTVGLQPGGSEVDIAYGRVDGPLEFTPDGRRLLLRRKQIGTGTELVSATFDGADPVSLLRISGRDVGPYQVTSDSRLVVYTADVAARNRFELFRVPVAGGQSAVRLHPPLPAQRTVEAFRISPDGTQVVYLADARTNDVVELFVVPLEGPGAPPRRLNTTLATGGDVLDFAFASDGWQVVYRADALANGRAELFSVPLGPSVRGHARASGGDDEPDAVQLTFLSGTESVEPDWRSASTEPRSSTARPPEPARRSSTASPCSAARLRNA